MLALRVGWEWGMSRAMVNARLVFADLLSGLAVSFTRWLNRLHQVKRGQTICTSQVIATCTARVSTILAPSPRSSAALLATGMPELERS